MESDVIRADTNYRRGQSDLSMFLAEQGIRLTRTEELGLQRDDSGWDHFAWTMHVKGRSGETFTFPLKQGVAHTQRPKLFELMGLLISDASCARGTFAEFCGDLGYDEDSRSAKSTYQEILINNGRLLKLFGVTDLDALLATVQPKMEAAGL